MLTPELARRAAGIDLSRVAEADVERARHCVLDWICATVAGARAGPARAVQASVVTAGASSVLGTGRRAAPRDAALANGVAAHALELDDVARWMRGHPGASVCSATFALAEEREAPAADVICALLAGYDTACRVALALGPGHSRAGWHATGTAGTIAAAAACGRLLRLPAERLEVALGLAATQAAGLTASIGTTGKPLHAGKAAADGMLAALLAAEGATAAANGVEAYAKAASTTFDPTRLEELGDAQGIRSVVFRRHACCGVAQPTVEAALQLRAAADRIASVHVTADAATLAVCPYLDPSDELQARFSLTYAAAVALDGRGTGPDSFTEEALRDEELAAIRRRVTVSEHSEPSTRVEVELADGSRLEAVELPGLPAEDSDLPAQWDRLADKFRSIVSPLLGAATAEAVIAAVGGLDERATVAGLLAPAA